MASSPAGASCRRSPGICRTATTARRPPYVNSPRDLPRAGADEGWRVERHGEVLSTWEIVHELPGRIRVRNRLIRRKPRRCAAIEGVLMRALGVDRYATNSSDGHRPDPLRSAHSSSVTSCCRSSIRPWSTPSARRPGTPPISTSRSARPRWASPPSASFRRPALLPLSAALFLYSVIPTFRGRPRHAEGAPARRRRARLHRRHRLSAGRAVFAGAVLGWCLGFGRSSSRRDAGRLAEAAAQRLRQAAAVRLAVPRRDARSRPRSSSSSPATSIVVNTGEVVPVDGEVVEGMAMIDQHALTGESTPAEKGVGDRSSPRP